MNVHIHDDHLAVGFPGSHNKDSNNTQHKEDNPQIHGRIRVCPNTAEFSTESTN